MGNASVVEMRNPRFLNAMDYDWLAPLETAVDLAILDPQTAIAVLRGGVVDNPKYAGRRMFSAGINLTNLYLGRIPFQFYVDHVMGFEHKIFRGIARPDAAPDDTAGATAEKAVDRDGRHVRHRRRLPASPGDGLRAGREGCLHDLAGAQGGHHPGLPPTCGCRASSATASRAKRSCTAAGSTATARKAA